MERPFVVVDVFGNGPFTGNPLAVVLDADGVPEERMRSFSAWTNLSETAYVCEPTRAGADYRVRIFNRDRELDFAGHPTLGACGAWLAHTGRRADRVVQECAVGLVEVRGRESGSFAFRAPPLRRSGDLDDADLAAVRAALGVGDTVRLVWADNGVGWTVALLGSADDVLALTPRPSPYHVAAVGAYPEGSPAAYEARAFFSTGDAVEEDPVTGSLHAALARIFSESGTLEPPYVGAQGAKRGRDGRVLVERLDGDLYIGGSVRVAASGAVDLS